MTTQLRIATWNLNRPRLRGWKRNPLLLQKLAAENADIWILTETNEAITLPGYHAVATNALADNGWRYLNLNHTEGENATTIMSRWPIRSVLPTFDDTVAVCADIDAPFGTVRVYGTILTWHADRGVDGTSRNWQEHYRAIAAHAEDWAKLRDATPFIVGGDLNVSLADSFYGTKHGRGLLLGALEQHKLFCASATLPHTIDHVCLPVEWADRQVSATSWQPSEPPATPLSDHQGTTIEIAW